MQQQYEFIYTHNAAYNGFAKSGRQRQREKDKMRII